MISSQSTQRHYNVASDPLNISDEELRDWLRANPQTKIKTRMRICDLVVNVSAQMEGGIEDWPANIQDGVYKALADRCHKSRADFKIVMSYSGNDVDTGPYIHVTAAVMETLQ